MDKPVSRPDIGSLSAEEYNKCLQDTYHYFIHKEVKIKDGRVGKVLGCDPRPMKGGGPTSPGQDGNYLCIRVPRKAAPGRDPYENVWFMPDDVELVVSSSPKEQDLKT